MTHPLLVGCRLGSVGRWLGWVGVGWASVGVGWGSVGGQISTPLGEGDSGQVTTFPPQNGAQNLGTGANQGRKWTQHP